ncbi:MAG: DUF4290 domain-containing protein [Clostridium sp.]|nr:DUF4290 domain-containing protein [Clostridium sp.]
MITYNTQLKHLVLPEYGRNIQQMVDHCRTIEDREERNRCARAIIQTMGNLFPELRDTPDYTHKLWDHLAIMADFDLDIDYPCEVVRPDELGTLPEPVPYTSGGMRFRHYGASLQHMIDQASIMENGPERDELVRLLANHMKKLLLAVNRDGVDDERVFRDLCELSKGAINIHPSQMRLHEFREAPQPQGGKKKKKK